MQDKIGSYYYPFPENKSVRMYVRKKGNDIEFRMKNDDDPKMWTEHKWITYDAVLQAKALYGSRNKFDPDRAYDIAAAKELLQR